MLRAGVVDLVLNDRIVGPWRASVCAEVSGRVLEIGFGSGRNLGFLGEPVTEVLAVDPSDAAWNLASGRIRQFARPVNRVGTSAELVPLPDASVDAVLSTWTMCSVADLEGALAEVRRVLRPGGALHFVEHSLDPSPRIARLQRTIQPAWGRVSGGCHVDRDLPVILAKAGWRIEDATSGYAARGPARPFAWFVTGKARPWDAAGRAGAS